jgi:hypothetical protein
VAGGIEERRPEMAGIDHRGESARLKSKRGGRREGNGKTRHRGEDKTEFAMSDDHRDGRHMSGRRTMPVTAWAREREEQRNG